MKKGYKILFIVLIVLFLMPFLIVKARSGCCSYHGGVCGCECCDGTPLSEKCAPYYPECNSYAPPQKTGGYQSIFADDKIDCKKDNLKIIATKIIDGDTIEFSCEKDKYKVRLIGIDTPEIVDPRKPIQCFGKEASAYLKSLIDKKEISLKKDKINTIDKYNRLLRYIVLDNKDINEKMIKDGFAYAYLNYPFDQKKMKAYKKAEDFARKNKKGLWTKNTCNGKRNK